MNYLAIICFILAAIFGLETLYAKKQQKKNFIITTGCLVALMPLLTLISIVVGGISILVHLFK